MATKSKKENITRQFESVIEELKKQITPTPNPQKFNHCVDVVSNWRGNYFYIKQKFKRPEGEGRDYEVGLARVEYQGPNSFNLAYFRHTGKWFPLWMYEDISLEEAKKAILGGHMFQVF